MPGETLAPTDYIIVHRGGKFFRATAESLGCAGSLVESLVYSWPVVGKGPGNGIQVDEDDPAFPWRDLEGPIRPKDSGAGRPTLSTYRGNIRAYAFTANDIVDCEFHWPHDYVPGTDVYIHVHWSHTGTNVSGQFVGSYRHSWAKGHNQGTWPAESTLTQTIGSLSIETHPRYQHIIDEVQLSAASPSAAQIDSASFEADGLLLVSFTPTTIPTVSGGSFFIHYIDIHYQSSNVGTKQKAPDFFA